MVRAGKLPGFRMGGGWRLGRADIERWIDDRRVTPARRDAHEGKLGRAEVDVQADLTPRGGYSRSKRLTIAATGDTKRGDRRGPKADS